MATITNIITTNEISSKAAEIYRKESGGIYYVCYHCGIHLNNIADTLAHIEFHFSTTNDIKIDQEPLDIVDIKCELLDDAQEVVDASQLEQIFIDCSNKSILMNEQQCVKTDASNNDSEETVPQTLAMTRENYEYIEGHYKLKCLYCFSMFKKFTKLEQHLIKHTNDPLPNVTNGLTTKAQYSFQCIACPLEFYDSSSSRQHVKDFHNPQPNKCIPCGRKFVSTQLLKDHMCTAHTKGDLTAETNKHKEGEVNSKALLSQYNTYLCILCDQSFTGTLNLMEHTFVHFNLKVFSCLQCPAHFQRLATFNNHMNKKHSLNMDQEVYNIRCRFCSEKMDNLFEFVTHSFTHHLDEGDRNNSDLDSSFNYDCRFCFKNFTKWKDSHLHLKEHSKDELPKGLPPALPAMNSRCFSERAKSGMHRSELLYNCFDCTKTLCGSFEARNHLTTEHKHSASNRNDTIQYNTISKSIWCYDCDNVFNSQFDLMKHRLMHFNVRPYTCTVCSKTFSVSRNATLHMIKFHHVKPDANYSQLDCHYCQAQFTGEVDFITHMFNDHLYVNFNINEDLDGQCKYECIYCKKVVTERNLMDQHLDIHKSETIAVVDTGRTSDESSLNALRHKVEFMYRCVHCSKRFRLPHPASEHAKYKHKTENLERRQKNKKPTTRDSHCNLCNITFLTWRSMLNHRAKLHPETHKKDRYKNRPTYYCSTCGKAYQDRGNLNQHEETHARLQSYTCDICDKSYRTKNYIRIHLLSHFGQKNFVCDQCGRSFYSVRYSLDVI